MLVLKIVIIDLETGGGPIEGSSVLDTSKPITQIAALSTTYPELQPGEEWERKVIFNPEKCDRTALETQGYFGREEEWEDAIPCRTAINGLNKFLRKHYTLLTNKKGIKYRGTMIAGHGESTLGTMVVGHNFNAFDKVFLDSRFDEYTDPQTGRPLWPAYRGLQPIDTLQLSNIWKIMTGAQTKELSIDALIDYFNIEKRVKHDALEDCRINLTIMRLMFQDIGNTTWDP